MIGSSARRHGAARKEGRRRLRNMKSLFFPAVASALCLAFLCQRVAVASADVDAAKGARPSRRVRVQLFYETHCPYSQSFITKQLWPTYVRLSDRLSVRLVPYGMARKREAVGADGHKTTEISCQHGRNECLANMIQACAVTLFKGTYRLLAFVVCMESSTTPHRVAKSCSSRVGVNWAALDRCASSRSGPRLLLKMGHKTASHRPAVPYVPFVVVNGKQGDDVQSRAATDFFGLVCSMFAEPAVPPACVSEQQQSQEQPEVPTASTAMLELRGLGFEAAAPTAASTDEAAAKRT
nr:gamma-interferon-inducible lysosomal thiol reductase-like isoform X2 [Dermacentor andersoni]